MVTSPDGVEFEKIKKEYSDFEDSLIKQGKKPMRDTGFGFWGCTILDEVYEFFKKINLGKYKHFLDLGSGDGRVVLIASLFTKATGIELDKELFEKSIELNKKLGLNGEFIHDDFMGVDLSGYDFLYIFPDKCFYMAFEDKLKKELSGVLAVCNETFLPTFLRKGQTVWAHQRPFVLFTK
ncbi:class I SAM-dependent methyltransferase [Nanoarchaeota archaeon]